MKESHSLLSLEGHQTDLTLDAGLPGPIAISGLQGSKNNAKVINWPWGALLPVAFLGALEIGSFFELIPSRLLPPPSEIAQTLYALAKRDLFAHIAISVARVAAGFSIGALLAIASLAWIPLLLLWMGIDETPKIALIAIGAFFPVYVNLVAGIHNVDRKLIEVGEIHGLPPRDLIRRILLPAALPNLFTGLRTGLSLAWMFLVAAELIAATKG